jgi:hypothetical protein
MSKSSKTEIEGLTLAITRLSAAGKSSQDILNYLECEMLVSEIVPSSKKPTAAKPTRRKRRKNLKGAILKFLAAQGKKGAHVKVIADAVRSKPANITAWIFSTGKKVKELKKVAPATYAFAGE